jgi:pimeloyl-ACP methyl ester carboxylesterase
MRSDYGTPRARDKNAVMQRTVLLVHGAWHGAWCWERVIPLLDLAAIPVVAVDLPSVSHHNATLHDDADYVRGALDSIEGEVVLLGHSYGGAVITAAGVHPNVAHLVYLCAFALEVGESAAKNALTGGEGPNELGAALVFGKGVLTVDPERAASAFYHDCTPDVAAAAVERLRPQSLAALGGEVDAAAWHDKPATYVVCTEDRALPVALQRSNAARIGEWVDWPTSHSPFLSRPDLVADLIIELSSR